MNRAGRWLDLPLLFFLLLPQMMPSVGVQGREQCAAGDASCAAEAGQRSRSSSLFPVYDNVEARSKTAVCIVSKASELQGLRIALLTILLQQPQMKVQLFAFDYVEEALADAISRMVSLLAPDGRVEIIRLSSEAGASHHEYGMLLKDEDFWFACDGELVLVFQADTMLCSGADMRLEDFLDYDYVGAPFRPGVCPVGHDKDRSMCQDDFDKMARHANLSIPFSGVGGNGGFSLRRRSKMIEVIRKCQQHPFLTWNEDIFFSYPCEGVSMRLPPEKLSRKFSVETGSFHAAPFGIHKVWAYRTDDEMAQLATACPELLLMIPT
mmetsp:Transcript_28082/g.45197  ORF Transcript_28082/g.45197 Transcript_28082/m.45197 type:complete len:323 (+) Transcript_28082:136-1104(+)